MAKSKEIAIFQNLKGVRPSTLRLLADLQARLPEYATQPATGMSYAAQNKYVSWRFSPRDFESLELLHITDVQYGHVECRVHRLLEYRDWVLAEPNRFMLWGGDMIDAAHAGSPGQPWDNWFDAQSQIYRFCELWAPARHRVLGYVGGNHERRGMGTFGDLGLTIATLLRIPYSNGQQLVDVHFGQHRPFKNNLWHGRGAARTSGGKAMMVAHYMEDNPGADVYWIGHLHSAVLVSRVVPERLPHKLNVTMKKSFGLMSTSFLSYWGTYAEVAGLSATDVLMWRVVLEPGGWEVTLR